MFELKGDASRVFLKRYDSVSRADNLSYSCVRQARYYWSSFYNLIEGLTMSTDMKKERN